jgi:hypothetical protein
MIRPFARYMVRSLVLILVCAAFVTPADGVKYKQKKRTQPTKPPSESDRSKQTVRSTQSLEAIFTATGSLTISVNGIGTELSFGTIEVDKPARVVVRKVFLAVAASGAFSHRIEDGEIRIDGHHIAWDRTATNAVGSWNAVADVTRLVKGEIDAAPAGRVPVDVWEDNSDLIDGVILAVVFDDPDASPDNDVALYFGAQSAKQDSFKVNLSRPVPADLTSMRYELGVGISFSQQTSGGTDQYTIIQVNGDRVTTAAGGPDDGSPAPGALLSIGGLDDSPANPIDAYAVPENLASDDEFYDLRPFLTPADTSILIHTATQSNEENLFFASFFAGRGGRVAAFQSAPVALAAAGLAPDGFVLSSSSGQTQVGAPCEITAVVQNGGAPMADVDVALKIVSGPHSGAVSQARTDSTGRATFLYRGKSAGRDLLVAVIDDGDGAVAGSNVVLHEWVDVMLDVFFDIAPGVCPNAVELGMQDLVTVAVVGTEDFDVSDIDVTSLYLEDAGPTRVQYRDVSRPGNGGDCDCSDGGGDGFQDLVLQFRLSEVLTDPSTVLDNERRNWTLSGSLKAGTSFETINCVLISRTSDQPMQLPDGVLVPLSTETTDPAPRR